MPAGAGYSRRDRFRGTSTRPILSIDGRPRAVLGLHRGWARRSARWIGYCDGCADRELARLTGWPVLPEPPPAEVLIGSDRRKHFIRYRFVRVPPAILGLAEELGRPAGSVTASSLPVTTSETRGCWASNCAHASVWRSATGLSKKYGSWRLSSDELRGRLEEDL